MKTKLVILLLFSLIILVFYVFTSLPDDKLRLVFCNVGQGDAALIRTPKGADILIDGGPDERVLKCLGEKMPFWDRSVELIILSHPQSDHLTGLIEVIKRYEVKQIIDSSAKCDTGECKLWEKLMSEKKIKKINAQKGQRITVDGNLVLTILWPVSFPVPSTPSAPVAPSLNTTDLNASSTVVRLSFSSFSALFTGDISALSDLSSLGDLSSTVLKVPHHGSKTGLSQKFLEAVSPKLAVISVGKNSYGHPAQETLKLLNNLNIKLLRTDQDNTIELVSNGKTWSVIK